MATAYEKVQLARNKNRPTGVSYIQNIFTDFIELHGDRRFGDDRAIVGGIAWLEGKPCTVIAIEKGSETRERVKRNFGMPYPEGYRKALRLMKQAEKFKRPIVTFIDTSGAFCGIGAEERGQGLAIAENLVEMIALKVPVIAILIGEGGSGGALALGVADKVWMMENAVYSVVSPEGCASILWKDAKKADQAAEVLKITSTDMESFGVVEKVIAEDKDFAKVYENIKNDLVQEIACLQEQSNEQMLENRYNRYRKF